ncbi:MAG TPA: allantoinase [Candidatus Binatia bacterium]|nr:allantoinase [Candidatus Binatia bacterium]
MAKLKLVRGGAPRLTLVYGMRLFPAAEVSMLASGRVGFTSGEEARITLHVIEGTRAQIEKQLLASVDAFFELHGKNEAP